MRICRWLTIFLCLLVLTSCQSASRQCDGFDHPLAEIWTGNDGLGEMRSFTDDAGNLINYSLQSIDKSGPRTETGRGSDSNRVTCYETAQYLYVQSNADIAYELDFLQSEVRGDQPIESQRVTLAVNTQNPVGNDTDIINLWGWFELADLEITTTPAPPEGTNFPSRSDYFTEMVIGGNVYVDLLQHTFNDNSGRFTSGVVDEEAKWVRVLLAKDVGLLQYELLNGTVYTLNRE